MSSVIGYTTAKVDALIEAAKNEAITESSVQYVSGIVTPDPLGLAVMEYFTIGPATIDNVPYEANTPVVLFRIGPRWVHKKISLPAIPTVSLLTSYLATIPDPTTQKTFTFGSGVTAKSGILVVTLTSWTSDPTSIVVGGVTVPIAVKGLANFRPVLGWVAVPAGTSLVTTVTMQDPVISLAASVALVTGVSPVPYANVPFSNSGPFTAPFSPGGSVIIGHVGNRLWQNNYATWNNGAVELDRKLLPRGNADWQGKHQTGWAFSTGVAGQTLTTATDDKVGIIFSASESS